ncbi:MAG TPA: hypothetical protein VMU54_24280 [Planctomycetota bacterium]|nr:hypothetical protein [Planctomycetota bacterium]
MVSRFSEARHRQIAREHPTEIAGDQPGSGGRLPSEAPLFRKLSGSRPTVAGALRERQGFRFS